MHDFLIVGGGVIGLSLAWELSRRDRRVCVVDRLETGKATSWVGAGIFPPPHELATHDPLEQLRSISHRLHLEWSERLLAETGIDNQLRRCGGLYFARRNGEAAALRVSMQQLADDGGSVEQLSAADLVRREPRLTAIADSVRVAYHLPDEMQLRSPRNLQALAKACEQKGVEIRASLAVDSIELEGELVSSLATAKGRLQAREYVLCGGPWSAQLLQPVGIGLPIEPWRGQLILWKPTTPLVNHVINEGFRYFVPRLDGHLLAGATVEDEGFDCQTTEAASEELRAWSCEILPELAELEIEQTWAGLRPRTPDGLPFLGRVPGVQNLSVATGHYRSGLHLAPVTAVLMTQLLLDDTPLIPMDAFRVLR